MNMVTQFLRCTGRASYFTSLFIYQQLMYTFLSQSFLSYNSKFDAFFSTPSSGSYWPFCGTHQNDTNTYRFWYQNFYTKFCV